MVNNKPLVSWLFYCCSITPGKLVIRNMVPFLHSETYIVFYDSASFNHFQKKKKRGICFCTYLPTNLFYKFVVIYLNRMLHIYLCFFSKQFSRCIPSVHLQCVMLIIHHFKPQEIYLFLRSSILI